MTAIINHIKKTEVECFGFFISILILFSCQKESHTTVDIIDKTVEAYGGLDKWNDMKQLSFDKEVTLYGEDGSLERATDQFQLFQFHKPFGKIEWEEDSISHMIINEDGKIIKVENDTIISAPNATKNAGRAFFASEFVIKQPFDLLSDKATLTRENDTIFNGKDFYIISVAYKDEAPDADRWHYVIDKQTFLIVANKVVLKDHTSWVENLTYDTTTDIKFNAHRKSYRLNNVGEKTYLRAEYFYTNYSVQYR